MAEPPISSLAQLAHAPVEEAADDLAASLAEAGTLQALEDADAGAPAAPSAPTRPPCACAPAASGTELCARAHEMGLRENESDQVIDKSDKKDPLYAISITSFEDPTLELGELILKGLFEMKFSRPSKIQAASLPKIKMGRNLLAQAHNGTGKTCCFVLGMLRIVTPDPDPQALCICPTRELAKQIEEEVLKMGKYLILEKGIKVKCVLRDERWERGDRISEQIVIGTPGKIVLDSNTIKMFVLDEADEMLMLGGLGDQSKRIRMRLRKDVQTLFFSATYTEPVKRLATQLSMDNPWSQIEVKREHIFNDQVAQYYYRTNGVTEKLERLTEILSVVNMGQCIIFVHLRDTVEQVSTGPKR
ncbi:P-loop containing nucleoside triphosphate hydrolase protein [Pavlovales sp. CCMP2436]|nr:P-loop containing nucleoside triphosphate hydrolase protein [Pavlovales sp. CCMP2436]